MVSLQTRVVINILQNTFLFGFTSAPGARYSNSTNITTFSIGHVVANKSQGISKGVSQTNSPFFDLQYSAYYGGTGGAGGNAWGGRGRASDYLDF